MEQLTTEQKLKRERQEKRSWKRIAKLTQEKLADFQRLCSEQRATLDELQLQCAMFESSQSKADRELRYKANTEGVDVVTTK